MKVLIIQHKMIGDVLTSTILFEALKRADPNAELHYLVENHTTPVLKGNPFIDKVIISDKTDKLRTRLKSEKYTTVIDVYSKVRSALLAKTIGAKITIGNTKWFSEFTYSKHFPLKTTSKKGVALAIENRLDLLQPLVADIPYDLKPKIYLEQEEVAILKKKLESFNIVTSKALYMINVLGSSQEKTYPLKAMATLLDVIVKEQPDAQLLFNYIPHQLEGAKAIYKACNKKTQLRINLDFYGASLREFIVLTSLCHALIGNEGGAINIAKALQVPTFAIFSPWIIKAAWNISVDDKNHFASHLQDYKPELFDSYSKKIFRKKQASLYQHFAPELITPDLKEFLRNIQ